MRLDLAPILAVHDAVRRDLVRLVQIVGGTVPVTDARATAVREHFTLVTAVLAAHERAEESVLWPDLRAALPTDDAVVVDSAASQHAALDGSVLSARSLLVQPGALDERASRDEAAAALERCSVLVDHHFGLEEDRLLPLVERWLPQERWEGFLDAWRRDVGPGGRAVVLPFLLDAAHPERAASLLAALADGQRAAYTGEWRPAHQARVALLW